MGMARRSRNKKGNAITSEGNDFVLKRYKLEENQTFSTSLSILEEAGHEDINYSLQPKGRAKEVEVEEQGLEEDLVIVPFNLQDNEED